MSTSQLRLEGDRGWLPRGVAAGAGTMIGSVLVLMGLTAVVISNGDFTWVDRKAATAVMFTLLWCVVAAGSAAVGTWQAAQGGAPHRAGARLAGTLGPVAVIAFISVVAFGASTPAPGVIIAEALAEIAAAVLGAQALARRLDEAW